MKARLDGIYSPDLPAGYGELPPNPANCWVVVQADIGSVGGRGADCFTMYVTTPQFLEGCLDKASHQMGRGLIVVAEFDWDVVENAVKETCATVEGESWAELAEKLSRYFLYEYE